MPIQLITGLPGAGKSLGAVAKLLEWRDTDATRPVFVLGVDGLKEGIAQVITPEDLEHWSEYPPGSIFVVDECQKYFPMRRSGESPAWIKKLSEHRHLGHDFLLMTQAPGYLDSYVRGLVDRHTHLVRKFGTHMVDRYEWPAVCMSPLSVSERKRAVKSLWRYPKRCFELYHSAELHTVKRRIPKKLLVLLVAPVVVVGVIVAVPMIMRRGEGLGKDPANARTASALVPQPSGVAGSGDAAARPRWASVSDYVHDHIPRVANQPWSAPVYDGQSVQAKPDLMCIEYERVINDQVQDLCSCFTEQVTPYDLHDLAACRTYARHGVYNPRRAPIGGPANQAAPVASASDSSASLGPPVSAVPVGTAVSPVFTPAWRSQAYIQPASQQAYQPSSMPSGG